MTRVSLSVFVFTVLSISIGGCGPIKSTQIIQRSDTALHKAKTAGAGDKAAYEYRSAELYLHKAREKWGTSDFEYALDYASKSLDFAKTAHDKSVKE